MNPTTKNLWLEALRSGKYKQGTYALRDEDNCFCCLGVLCDVIDPVGWTDVTCRSSMNSKRVFKHQGASAFPNIQLLEQHFNFSRCDVREKLSKLAGANDGGISFAEIADRIEQDPYL